LSAHPSADIRIVDTRLGSTAEALLVYEALRKREEGLTADEMERWANEARFCVETYFMVDDLDALQRGGRIPKGVAFAGTKLNVKPILTFSENGRLVIAGAARGRKKGLRALAERFEEHVDISGPAVVCMGHADCEKDMIRLWDMLPGDGSVLQRVSQPIGPVVGSHVGPGMVSLVFWGRDRRER
jgi:DegV family protein with EDD domain